mmetsp:Transcript_12634/g.37245  ORF Transcript_12634/g.37245 Transcript_12634/m.37245 type:complete len:249 (-) Transcript_12634:135-881(-)
MVALAGSFFNWISTSLILATSAASSTLSCVNSTSLTTRCHELSFSRSASMASSFSCSSVRFLDIRCSRRVSRSVWKFSRSARACSTTSAFSAFSLSLRSLRVTCHSSFHFCIGEGSLVSSMGFGSSSPAPSTGSSPAVSGAGIANAVSSAGGSGMRTAGDPSSTSPMKPESARGAAKSAGGAAKSAAKSGESSVMGGPMKMGSSEGGGAPNTMGSLSAGGAGASSEGGLKKSEVCSSMVVAQFFTVRQ